MIYLIGYGATALTFLLLDAIWLTLMVNVIYRPTIGDMLLKQYNLGAAITFYLVYVLGIVVMAVVPGLQSGRWTSALLNGALLGFFAYATYNLTNQATLRNWSTLLTATDIAWGTFVTSVAATAGYLAVRLLSSPS